MRVPNWLKVYVPNRQSKRCAPPPPAGRIGGSVLGKGKRLACTSAPHRKQLQQEIPPFSYTAGRIFSVDFIGTQQSQRRWLYKFDRNLSSLMHLDQHPISWNKLPHSHYKGKQRDKLFTVLYDLPAKVSELQFGIRQQHCPKNFNLSKSLNYQHACISSCLVQHWVARSSAGHIYATPRPVPQRILFVRDTWKASNLSFRNFIKTSDKRIGGRPAVICVHDTNTLSKHFLDKR